MFQQRGKPIIRLIMFQQRGKPIIRLIRNVSAAREAYN